MISALATDLKAAEDRIARLERCLVRSVPTDSERLLGAIETLHDTLRHISPVAVDEADAPLLDSITTDIYSAIEKVERLAAIETERECEGVA